MKESSRGRSLLPAVRPLNAVALQSAVLCAQCDVVSDSPHDICMVCGSCSLINISRMLGGNLPKNRAMRIEHEPREVRKVVPSFSRPHQVRTRASSYSG